MLTVKEAEAVLGKLVVPPYRSDDGTPLAVENGNSSQLSHRWTPRAGPASDLGVRRHGVRGDQDGRDRWRRSRPRCTWTRPTPWTTAPGRRRGPALTGELYFLNGDRFLEVNYLTSTTDMNGAVGLSRTALGRLGSGEAKPATAAAGKKLTGGCPTVEQVGQAAGFRVP